MNSNTSDPFSSSPADRGSATDNGAADGAATGNTTADGAATGNTTADGAATGNTTADGAATGNSTADGYVTGDDGNARTWKDQPIRRPRRGRMVAGVAAAIARHFNVDVAIVRVVFVALTVIGFTGLPFFGAVPFYLGGIPLYLACWLLIPEEGSEHSIAANFLHSRRTRSR